MKTSIYKKYLFNLFFGMLFLTSCIEPYEIGSTTFEDLLVVQATITNEYKYQTVKLTRTYSFQDDTPPNENGAQVIISDSSQNSYTFHESGNGVYTSDVEFAIEPGKKYQLSINTKSGKSYLSTEEELQGISKIDSVYALRVMDNLGNENVAIFVDSYNPIGDSRYYRYEYDETYKIIAPFWAPYDMIPYINEYGNYAIKKELKTYEQRICYNTVFSKNIIQTETNGFTEDRVKKFPVRLISTADPVLSNRYSILVKQYVQTLEAYTYYKTNYKFSQSESLFSQNQTGFVAGNLFSTENQEEKVLGFFDVCSVDSKRIFFNYEDLFPDEYFPPYFIDCKLFAPSNSSDLPPSEPTPLEEALLSGRAKYYGINIEPKEGEGPYLLVAAPCGDCTKYGVNVKPDFWKD